MLKDDIREGYGKFTWANGDSYEGNWKEGKMEGGGKFYHHQGNVLTGVFKNNYFFQNGFPVNPFLSREEIAAIEKRHKDIQAAKEQTKRNKQFIFEKTDNFQRVAELIKKSNANKRIPLIMTVKDSPLTKHDLYDILANATGKELFEFDVRYAAECKKDSNEYKKYMLKIKNDLARVLTKNQLFVINIDDSKVPYEEIFDPDLREFYDAYAFPSQIFDLHEMHKFEVNDKVVMESDYRTMRAGHEFNFAIWSKFRVGGDLESKKIIEKFERRFSSILPTTKLDLILLL